LQNDVKKIIPLNLSRLLEQSTKAHQTSTPISSITARLRLGGFSLPFHGNKILRRRQTSLLGRKGKEVVALSWALGLCRK
jgi:hypothetical protein